MAYVFAEVNFAAPQDPGGAIIGLDGISAGLVALFEATGDAFSCVRFSCWLSALWANVGRLMKAESASNPKIVLSCFILEPPTIERRSSHLSLSENLMRTL
jgi:hypothetical protein